MLGKSCTTSSVTGCTVKAATVDLNLEYHPTQNPKTKAKALVKSPTEFMVQTARALGSTKLSRLIVASGSGMGQTLFDPPDVGGWPNNEAWISSNTVIERVNFVTGALAQATSLPPSSDAVKHQLDGIVGPQTASMLNSATDERIKWFVALASPEFQLK